ncbi:MAG: hypothetical protein HYY45_06830 [Deltaproteobacteria bacterium]|nr:hypothetical protein [Deltaproteobacteria bacterium]
MIISDEQKSLVQRVLDLANIKDIRYTDQVERLFREHPLVVRFPLWRKIGRKSDVASFIDMRDTLREWFKMIVATNDKARGKKTEVTPKYDMIKVKNDIVRQFQTDCVETAHILAHDRNGTVKPVLCFKTWGIPTLSFDRHGNLRFDALPFLSGVQSAAWFGLILLFTSGLTRNVEQCQAKYKDGLPCGKFYLKTKILRVACSKKCKRRVRHAQIYGYVKEIRREQKRKNPKVRSAPFT